MKSLSIWGSNHPKKSVAILIALHILLQMLAVVLGILLYFSDWGPSKWLFISAIILYIVGSLFYPIKNSKYLLFKHSYVKQKSFDFVLTAAYIIILILGVNNFFIQSTPMPQQQELNAPSSRLIAYTPDAKISTPKSKRAETRAERKNVRKQIKAQLKVLKKKWKKRRGSGIGQVLLILLTILLTIVLLYLIAGISCGLSCSGQGGLAIFVLVVGVAGTIVLAVFVIRKIIGKKGERKPRVKKGL